jgi:YcxB-like protein
MLPRDQSELALQVKLKKADIYSAVLANSIRLPIVWLFPIGVGSGMYTALSQYKYGWIFAAAVALLSFWLIPLSAAHASAKMPGVLAPITYSFSDGGITAEYEKAKSSADWSLVKGARETDKFLFIKMQRGTFHLIPKGQMTEVQATLLRQLLRAHVPANVRISN